MKEKTEKGTFILQFQMLEKNQKYMYKLYLFLIEYYLMDRINLNVNNC